MNSYLKAALWIGIIIALFIIFPALLLIVLLFILWWLFSNLSEHGPKWIWWQRNKLFLRLGRFRWFSKLPWISHILRRVQAEEDRRKAEIQRQQAEAYARKKEAYDRAQKEHDALIQRPIPPDIMRDMRAFLDGNFVGEDRSPLAFVGYRVGKTRGLNYRERQRRLDACFRINIPSDLDPKYHAWGGPATYQRYHSIEKHLKMLADMRSGRSNQRFAVADWEKDRKWFRNKYLQLAKLLELHPPRGYR